MVKLRLHDLEVIGSNPLRSRSFNFGLRNNAGDDKILPSCAGSMEKQDYYECAERVKHKHAVRGAA